MAIFNAYYPCLRAALLRTNDETKKKLEKEVEQNLRLEDMEKRISRELASKERDFMRSKEKLGAMVCTFVHATVACFAHAYSRFHNISPLRILFCFHLVPCR